MNTIYEKSIGNRIADIVIYGILGILILVATIPIIMLIVQSFSATRDIIPKEWTLASYEYIFSTRTLFMSIGISIYISVFGTIISLILTAMFAYGLAENTLPGRNVLLYLVVITMLFNAGLIPHYLVVIKTGLDNTLWSVMIPNAINAFYLVVMKNFFQNVPKDLKEASRIDGAHEITILIKIILPLSLPVMAAIGLFYVVEKWNMYFEPLLYLRDSWKRPAQVVLRAIIRAVSGSLGGDESYVADDNVSVMDQGIRAASIIISSLPIMMVYPFLQKHFTKGLLLGSVKG
jgi:putative aldouronate transport system permease protein